MNNRRFEIIKCAERRFVRHGAAKSTLDEIARDLRIGKATIYHYFESKEELYFTVLRNQIDEFCKFLDEAFLKEDLPHADKIRLYLKTKLEFPQKYPLLFSILKEAFEEFPIKEEKELFQELVQKENLTIQKYFDTFPKKSKNRVKWNNLIPGLPLMTYTFSLAINIENKLLEEKKTDAIEKWMKLINDELLFEEDQSVSS